MKKTKYKNLSDSSKDYAKWEVGQRNSVLESNGKIGNLTIENSSFYTNGVYAGRINK